jgi:hypothetical protein
MIWPNQRLLDLLGIDLPIIQAPMAGLATSAMAAARALCLLTSREILTGKPIITARCGIYTTLPLSLRSSKIASNSITRPNPKPPKLRTWRGRTNCRYRRRRPRLIHYPIIQKKQRRRALAAAPRLASPTIFLSSMHPEFEGFEVIQTIETTHPPA